MLSLTSTFCRRVALIGALALPGLLSTSCGSAPSPYDGRPDSMLDATERLLRDAWAKCRETSVVVGTRSDVPLDRDLRLTVVEWRHADASGMSQAQLEREFGVAVSADAGFRYVAHDELKQLWSTHLQDAVEQGVDPAAAVWASIATLTPQAASDLFRESFDVALRVTLRRTGGELQIDLEARTLGGDRVDSVRAAQDIRGV